MKVFLSSTFADLKDHRQAVFEEIQYECDVLRMEDFGSSGLAPLEYCLGLAEEADLFVLLIGYRYGSRDAAAGISYTEAEYEHAKTHGRPVHGYIREDF